MGDSLEPGAEDLLVVPSGSGQFETDGDSNGIYDPPGGSSSRRRVSGDDRSPERSGKRSRFSGDYYVPSPEFVSELIVNGDGYEYVHHKVLAVEGENQARALCKKFSETRKFQPKKSYGVAIFSYHDSPRYGPHIHSLHTCQLHCKCRSFAKWKSMSITTRTNTNRLFQLIQYIYSRDRRILCLQGGRSYTEFEYEDGAELLSEGTGWATLWSKSLEYTNTSDIADSAVSILLGNAIDTRAPEIGSANTVHLAQFPGWFELLEEASLLNIGLTPNLLHKADQFIVNYLDGNRPFNTIREWYKVPRTRREQIWACVNDLINTRWFHLPFEEKLKHMCTENLNWGLQGVRYHTIPMSRAGLLKLLISDFPSEDAFRGFLDAFVTWITKKDNKKNTLMIVSAPSCGKNYFFDCFVMLMGGPEFVGVITQVIARNTSPFFLENSINKIFTKHNEPAISSDKHEQMLEVYGGDPAKAMCKNRGEQVLDRTPVLITSNPSSTTHDLQSIPRFQDRIVPFEWMPKPWLREFGRHEKPHPVAMAQMFLDYLEDPNAVWEEAKEYIDVDLEYN